MRKRGIITAALATVAAGILGAPAAHADGHGVGVYGVWANSVNVRDNAPGTTGCGVYPSVANCPSVQTKVNAGETVTVICQQPGQTVGGNPYWVLVSTTNGNHMGYMASYYIKNTTNWIDGVGRCQ
ncbi:MULTISPECIES: hypothetical protein [unclassified Streptomyces]|uniref:SH3b domain-containing protein n=1 Tax=Streptomyces sp. R08 TaxID=3238624 RepID=A0AB39MM85_9ACTN|nr:hypothetical protein [Streptomyces sp. NBC_00696]